MKIHPKKNEIVLDASLLSEPHDSTPDCAEAFALEAHTLVSKSLGEDLRAVFSDVMDEAVPQRFIDLLDTLEKKDES